MGLRDVQPVLQRRLEVIGDGGRAAQDLAGEDARAERHGAAHLHLGLDVAGQRLGGIVAVVQRGRRRQPGFQHAGHHGAVEVLLAGEIIVHVGLGQPGAGGDGGGRRAPESELGEHRFSRLQDDPDILLADGRLRLDCRQDRPPVPR